MDYIKHIYYEAFLNTTKHLIKHIFSSYLISF